ncbi:MAG: hypothetical protein ABL951_02555 [Alphaproteobacteria bacterium]
MNLAENNITKLYVGYFNRAPDPAGFAYWMQRNFDGMPLLAIANSFFVQPETQAIYGGLNNEALLTLIYQNLFRRAPIGYILNNYHQITLYTHEMGHWWFRPAAPGTENSYSRLVKINGIHAEIDHPYVVSVYGGPLPINPVYLEGDYVHFEDEACIMYKAIGHQEIRYIQPVERAVLRAMGIA